MKLIESSLIKEKAYIEKLENGLTVIIIPKNNTNKKYIIGSEKVEFNFKHISKIEGVNVNKMNKIDEHIKSHPDVSRNTIPEQLMILNTLLGGFEYN